MFYHISNTLITVLCANLIATSGDITMSWTSPILPKLYSNDSSVNPLPRAITEAEDSWIASLINIGAIIGPFPFSFIAEKFGRKVSLLLIAIPHIISYLMLAFAKTVNLFYLARFLGGLSVGAGYTLLPMYIAEIAEDSNRGRLSVTMNIFWTLGNLIPYVLGPYLSITTFNLILAGVPSSFFLLFLLMAPETPYYLIRNGKLDSAENCLMKLRSKNCDEVTSEIQHIKSVLEEDKRAKVSNLFRSRTCLKALFVSLILITAQQLSGINSIMFYAQIIFETAGTKIPSDISSIVFGLVLFSSSFTTPFVADKWGRKPLLIISNLGIASAHSAFGIYFYLKDSTTIDVHPIFWVPITSLIFFTVSFNIGASPVPWTISSELFPATVKPVAASLVSVTCWTVSFSVTKFFNDLNSSIGWCGTFWLYAGVCLATAIFTFIYVPETKGRSFKEIQERLANIN